MNGIELNNGIRTYAAEFSCLYHAAEVHTIRAQSKFTGLETVVYSFNQCSSAITQAQGYGVAMTQWYYLTGAESMVRLDGDGLIVLRHGSRICDQILLPPLLEVFLYSHFFRRGDHQFKPTYYLRTFSRYPSLSQKCQPWITNKRIWPLPDLENSLKHLKTNCSPISPRRAAWIPTSGIW